MHKKIGVIPRSPFEPIHSVVVYYTHCVIREIHVTWAKCNKTNTKEKKAASRFTRQRWIKVELIKVYTFIFC